MFQRIRQNENPFIYAGQKASIGLTDLFGKNGKMNKGYEDFSFNPAQVANMPGYQFQLKQGDRALQSSDATTVGALSGADLKDLMSFNQQLTGTYEQQYFNQALQGYQTNQGNYYTNQQNIFNRLSQIASLGQNAAGNLGSNGANLGTGVAQAQAQAGSSLAAGQMAGYNALGNATSSIPLYMLMAQNGGNPGGTSETNVPGAYDPNTGGTIGSDRRLKIDITPIGKTDAGLTVYKYRYKGGNTFHMGVMADEVREKFPEAVHRGEDGFDSVNYGLVQ